MGAFGAAVVPDDATHPDALQRRRAGDGRLRHGARRDSRRGRSRQAGDGVRRRNAAVPAGRPADGVGAGARRHRDDGHHRQHGRRADAAGQSRTSWSSAPTASPPTATSPTRSAPTRVAVLAREHGIPFYVAAPLSTIDLDTPDGSRIPIEERNAREVTHVGGSQLAPDGALVWNPAFDVTPHQLIAGIITERGIFRAAVHRVAEGAPSTAPGVDRADARHRDVVRRDGRRGRRGNRRAGAPVGDPLERRRVAGVDPPGMGRRRAGARLASAHSRHLRRGRARARRRRRSLDRSRRDRGDAGARAGRLAAGRRVVREGGGGAAGLPLVAVHHLAGHIESLVLQNGELPLPAVVLVVSGGHTSLYLVERPGHYQLLEPHA